jgi:hypothetical protein
VNLLFQVSLEMQTKERIQPKLHRALQFVRKFDPDHVRLNITMRWPFCSHKADGWVSEAQRGEESCLSSHSQKVSLLGPKLCSFPPSLWAHSRAHTRDVHGVPTRALGSHIQEHYRPIKIVLTFS